jgi:hypothetical protein
MEDLQVIIERLDNLINTNKEEHSRIEEQTKKTNGSVASLKIWRAYLTGAVAVLSAIVFPILMSTVYKFLDK